MLQNEKDERQKSIIPFYNEDKLNEYINIKNNFPKSKKYIHISRTKEEIVQDYWLAHMISMVVIFHFSKEFFNHLPPYGPIIFLTLIAIAIIIQLTILYWSIFKFKKFYIKLFPKTGGIVLLLLISKSFYIIALGDETLGSNFEKPEYRTNYFIEIKPAFGGSSFQRAPATIYVHKETDEIEYDEDRFGQATYKYYDTKSIELEMVYLPSGLTLNFYNCPIQLEHEIECGDTSGNTWIVALTSDKVQ